MAAARLPRLARAPGPGGPRDESVRPHRHRRRRGVPAQGGGLRSDPSRPPVDHRRRLVDGLLRGRSADSGAARSRPSRPARVPAEPRPPLRLGEQPGTGAGRDRCRHPGSRGRPDRTPARRHPERRPARGGDGARLSSRAATHVRRPRRGTAHRPGTPALTRHRRLAGRPGRHRSRHAGRAPGVPRRRSRQPAHGEGGAGAVVGPGPRARAAPGAGRAPTPRRARRAAGDQREDHAGRRLRDPHRCHARPLPRRPRPDHRQPRTVVHRRGCPRRVRRGARRGRVPGARARLGRPRGAREPGRGRARDQP